MNKKILASLLVIGVVAAVAGGSTFALFNDTETSSGNTFTAGELDLKIDWNESYNGENVENQPLTDNPGPIFDIQDVKPGDYGEATVSLHVSDNPAYVDMNFTQTANFENGCSEPEQEVDSSCGDPGPGEGELGENLYFTVWNDDGDNIYQEDEEVFFNGTAEELDQKRTVWLDGDSETEGVQPFDPSTTQYVGIKWKVPRDVGNEIQTDSKEFNFTFWAEQARHNQPKNMTDPETEPPEEPPGEPGEETETTVNVMKHVCDEEIQNVSEFNQVDGPDQGDTTEFHDKVLACPTVVQEGDEYSNNSVNFGEKRDFNFEVASDSGTQDIDGAEFVQQKLNESDVGIDVNGDGDMNDALDTSLYVYTGVTEGLVNVTETETPGDTRPGALEFTPDAIAANDDEATLLENQDDVFADDSTIQLNTSLDTEDDTVTLHVYNFQNVDNETEPPVDNNETDDRAAISFVSFCVGNQTQQTGQQTANMPCPGNQTQIVKFEWDGNSFEPEGGDAMNISINPTEFKDNDPSEPVKADWTSQQNITTAVVKSAQDICNYTGGTNGTVESCGPPPGQQP